MADTMVYDSELMDDISSKFAEGAETMEDVITSFNGVISSFPSYYEGQVSDEIFDSFSSTLLNHFDLLKRCYENMGQYVTDAKDEFLAADEDRSRHISGSGNIHGGGGGHSF